MLCFTNVVGSNSSSLHWVDVLLCLFIYLFIFLWDSNNLLQEGSQEWLLQEGFPRLWRGTSASLALAVPTVSSLFCLEFSVSCFMVYFKVYTLYFGSHYLLYTNDLVFFCCQNRLESTCLVMIFYATWWRILQLRMLQI